MAHRVDEILKERQATYGDPADNFFQMGRIWGAILNIDDIPAWQVALMMDGFKTVRCAANPKHRDSWEDKLGYTKIGMRIAIKEPEFGEELAGKAEPIKRWVAWDQLYNRWFDCRDSRHDEGGCEKEGTHRTHVSTNAEIDK